MPIFTIAKDEGAEDSDVKQSLWKKLKDPFFLFMILGVILFLLVGRLGEVTYDKAAIGGTGLFILALFIKISGAFLKYNSPAIIGENFRSSFAAKLEKIGDYCVFRLGGSTYITNLEGREGTVVVPVSSVNPLGSGGNIATTVTIKQVPLIEFPPPVYEFLLQKKLPPPYFWGISSEEIQIKMMHNPDSSAKLTEATVSELWTIIRNQNRLINEQQDHIRGKGKMVQQIVEGQKIASETVARPSRRKIIGYDKDKEE